MNTVFSIVIDHPNARYARQAAQAAFAEIDRTESKLSQFVEGNDISRLNRSRPNQPTRLGLDAFNCLLRAKGLHEVTNGSFDPSFGTGMNTLEFDRETGNVTKRNAQTDIDLGGIGKGYTLDQLAEVFPDWELTRLCADGGGSTVLALDSPTDLRGWPIGLGTGDGSFTIALHRASISGSGTPTQGEHIFVSAQPGRQLNNRRCWAFSRFATESDGLSTALMTLPLDAIKTVYDSQPEAAAIVEKYVSGTTVRRYFSHPAFRLNTS